jgi:hypothetical protein
MSKDIRLTQTCTHQTVDERIYLATDRRSLFPRQPVSSTSSIQVFLNEIEVPSTGLFSTAEVVSSKSGPYRINSEYTNFVIENSLGSTTFSLPVGTRIETNTLVEFFSATLTSIEVSNENGYLKFKDISKQGSESFLEMSGYGRSCLGLCLQSGSRGRQVFPGWNTYKRNDNVDGNYIRFTKQIKGNPIYKLTYAVLPDQCLRCGGGYIENDYRFDSTGDALLVDNENLLYQCALKIILTTKGTNPYASWYGTSIKSRIGSKAVSYVASSINEEVRSALQNLQRLQQEQSKYQQVSFKERLYQIVNVETSPHIEDPTTYLVNVIVKNASNEQVNVSVVYTSPKTTALINSNGTLIKAM